MDDTTSQAHRLLRPARVLPVRNRSPAIEFKVTYPGRQGKIPSGGTQARFARKPCNWRA
jgi:hypothetical protein